MGSRREKHRGVIGIDPGAVTGWSSFWEAELISAGTIKRGKLEELPVPEMLPGVIVIEKPVVYPTGLGKGDPNELIDLALWAGEIAGWLRARAPGVDIVFVAPRRWKGTVPKHISNERTLDALEGSERLKLPRRPRAKDFDHNMLDAVGIGLWQLERERQR